MNGKMGIGDWGKCGDVDSVGDSIVWLIKVISLSPIIHRKIPNEIGDLEVAFVARYIMTTILRHYKYYL